ncbi:MAG TPA: nuclear transport factor 2 family protein [Rhizomicrobium sp.]|jgi:hypothetical protein|nr:nuclear transport factor 2 family protein [Rhizomicrobium sp.]
MPDIAIAQELDARHRAANAAFEQRDIDAYRALFSTALAYRQNDGKVIGRDALMRNVAQQFRNLTRVTSTFTRLELAQADNGVVEHLIQSGSAQATAFGFVHRSWVIARVGDYTWTRENGIWVIRQVQVLSETLSPTGWRIGKR